MEYGHWEFEHRFDPEEWFGFIYRIINLETGQEYIGKKQFQNTRRKKVKGRKNRKVTKTESDWKTYTSSSTHLNKEIEEEGKDKFKFIIESLHKSRASLYYAEIRLQVIEDVLRVRIDENTKKYYNRQIGSVKFIPPDELPEEKKMKTYLVEHYRNMVRNNGKI